MSAQARQPKVLRIGIILDGKVAHEELVEHGQSVTVGSAEGATFVVPELDVGPEPITMFAFHDGRYHLQLSPGMKGKAKLGGEDVLLHKAASQGVGEAVDGGHSIPLAEGDKGMVQLAPARILFQFVTPPPVAAAPPVEQLDFRPRFFAAEDDPIFLGMLALWSALGLVFGIAVTIAEPQELTLDDIPDRFTRPVFVEPPPAEDLPEEEVDEDKPVDEDAVAEAVRKAEEDKVEEERREPETLEEKVEEAEAIEDAKQELMEESPLFKQMQALMIGTTGENARGTVLRENAAGDYDGIEERLAMAEAAGASLGDGSLIRGSDATPGGSGDRDIGGPSAGGDASGDAVALGEAPKVEVKGSVSAGDLDFGGDEVAGLGKVVRRYQGQLKYCYESSLKSNPSLAGRVVVAWYVEAEKAIDIYVAENTTGDEDFADCIKSKIRRWSFAGVDDGDAKQPFVFQPSEG